MIDVDDILLPIIKICITIIVILLTCFSVWMAIIAVSDPCFAKVNFSTNSLEVKK